MENAIKIKGARQHNLKNINVDIPKNKLVVLCGVSGSGKSSLAFDTLYAEGQRRYVESLSAYARQFLGIMEKPDVDSIEGLSPAISIDQKTTSRNPRSTVGTVTEIYDYLRLLYSRIGHPHCPVCGREISHQSLEQIVEEAIKLIEKTAKSDKKARFLILAPIVRDRKGEFSSLLDNLKSKGFKKVRVDGYIKDVSDDFILIKTNKHTIEAVVDKISLIISDLKKDSFLTNLKSRLSDSIQLTLKISDGNLIMAKVKDPGFDFPDYPRMFEDHLFSELFACPVDNIQIPEMEPRTFSFNSPHGACGKCSGLGKILKVNPALIFAEEITIKEGGVLPFASMFEHDTWYSRLFLKTCESIGIDTKIPMNKLPQIHKDILLYGTGNKEYLVDGRNKSGVLTSIRQRFIGIVAELERRYNRTDSDYIRMEIEKYMRREVCASCEGKRLKKESLGVTIYDKSIATVTSYPIDGILNWTNHIQKGNIISKREAEIGKLIFNEITGRLNFLKDVGLEYLTLDREAGSLSGGEAQRIRLASQIGSGLTGVLYVLDEPTIGLHQKDNKKLIITLKKLRDLGNTVVVVEHDREMIGSADWVIDFGPQAGKKGGEVVAYGTPKDIVKNTRSLTGKYLCGKRKIVLDSWTQDTIVRNAALKIYGCRQYNLKDINVQFPLGKFVVITGVSGSGKSTLLVETLYPGLFQKINPFFKGDIGKYTKIEGEENIDKVILIDQSPIGRTPRSNPATYTKLFDVVRDLFTTTKESRSLGFKKGRFSFNVKGGRCESCEGQGQIKIEMQFMSDIWVTCDVCKGKRYNSQTLEVTYRGKNIADVLNMTVNEAKEYFFAHPLILSKLETLSLVGLDYIELGQPATTLSGGEAQRVKLSSELSKKSTGKTVYILDEPTTGLHFADVERLLKVLKMLVAKGNSIFLIEHNLDVIKNADWIIDMGPDGGEKGGEIVAQGTVKDLKYNKASYTGRYL